LVLPLRAAEMDFREASMRRILLFVTAGLLGVVGILAVAGPAQAHDPYYAPRYYQHYSYHNDLAYREYQRQAYHWQAHQYPMTFWDHRQLHRNLNYDRFSDRLEHRQYHQYLYSPYSGYGVGIYSPGFSLYFGR
jgi:hypothetical protein